MSDCSNHRKDLFGESDMQKVAIAIGDMDYAPLAKLLNHLKHKLYNDSIKDRDAGRTKLAEALLMAADKCRDFHYYIMKAQEISKPFMEPENKKS